MERGRRRRSEGKKTGPNPTDRGKGGTKRCVLTEAEGIPIGLAVDGANRNDFKMARETVENIPVNRPRPSARHRQGMCMDKGFVRWEKRADTYVAMLHLACGIITWRAADLLG